MKTIMEMHHYYIWVGLPEFKIPL